MTASYLFRSFAYRNIHLRLIVLYHGDLVFVDVAVIFHPVHYMKHDIGHGQIYTQFVGIVLGIMDVLLVNRNAGARFVIPA